MAKIQPAITSLSYLVANGVSYIDLARDLSRLNRRLYRQGRNYAVESISVTCPGIGMKQSDVLVMRVDTIGNSWTTHNAWTKMFAAWRAQQKEATKFMPSVHGSWADFKVYLDDSHRSGTTVDVVAGDGAAVSAGEWVYSQLVWDDDGTEREPFVHMIGSTTPASDLGAIEEYGNSRARVAEGEPPVENEASDSIYAKLLGTDELTTMIIDNIEGTNDSPPYDANDYYGGTSNGDAAHIQRFLAVSAMEFTRTTPGFIAPCGLIRIVTEENALDTNGFLADASTANGVYASTSAPTAMVTINLIPGPYKGVLAPPMGQ